MGLYPSATINTENATLVEVTGITANTVNPNLVAYRKWKSIISAEVGQFIVRKGLTHEKDESLHLLKFELEIDNVDNAECHRLKFVGVCQFRKKPRYNILINNQGQEICIEQQNVVDYLYSNN